MQGLKGDVTVRHGFATGDREPMLRLQQTAFEATDHEGPVAEVCLRVTDRGTSPSGSPTVRDESRVNGQLASVASLGGALG